MRVWRWFGLATSGLVLVACGPPWQPVEGGLAFPDESVGPSDLALERSPAADARPLFPDASAGDLSVSEPARDAAVDGQSAPVDEAMSIDEAMPADAAIPTDQSWPEYALDPPLDDLLGVDLTAQACPGFLPATRWPVGAWNTTVMAVGDVNGDGNADLVVPDYSGGGTVSVVLGDGKGGFKEDLEVPGVAGLAALGDFNGDKLLDLAAFGGGISVLPGRGDGTFRAPLVLKVNPSTGYFAAGDFNNDGKLDLATSACGENAQMQPADGWVSVFLGKGDGTFGPGSDLPGGSDPNAIALADFNRDGAVDLAVASDDYKECSIRIFLGDGKGGFLPPAVVSAGCKTGVRNLEVADMNHDGIADLVGTAGDVDILVLLGKGDGTFLPGAGSSVADPNLVLGTGGIAVGDLDRDGNPDVATTVAGYFIMNFVGTYYSYVAVSYGDGKGGLKPPVICQIDYWPEPIRAVDLNHDGKLDLVTYIARRGGAGVLEVLLGK